MTGLAAEVRRVHVGYAAIACCTHDDKVDKCSHNHKIHAVAKYRIAEVNLWVGGRQLTHGFEASPTKPDSDGNQEKSKNKKGRQAQIDEDADVWACWAASSENIHDPEANQGHGRRRGERAADQTDRVISKK